VLSNTRTEHCLASTQSTAVLVDNKQLGVETEPVRHRAADVPHSERVEDLERKAVRVVVDVDAEAVRGPERERNEELLFRVARLRLGSRSAQ